MKGHATLEPGVRDHLAVNDEVTYRGPVFRADGTSEMEELTVPIISIKDMPRTFGDEGARVRVQFVDA
jgi:hypothetical protein